MRTARALLFGAIVGCGPGLADAPSSGSSDGGGTTGSRTTTDPTTGASVGTSVGSTVADTGEGTTAACDPDEDEAGDEVHLDLAADIECNSFDQDCPAMEKCVPYGFETRHCVPIPVEPIPDGEPCDAIQDDPCGPTSWCGLARDGVGTCVPLCGGTHDEPVCPGDTICVIDDEGIVAFCQRPCDPFVADSCPADTCQATPHGFGCVPAGAVQRGEFCYEDDSCADGMVCRHHSFVASCCHARCCTTLCSAEHPCDGGTCAFDPAVPGSEDVGYCG